MEIQLSMMILEVRELAASIAFYRLLGLDRPDPEPGRPVVIHRMGNGVSLLLTTSFAATYDPAWTRPAGGYQQLLEFFVGDDAVALEPPTRRHDATHVLGRHRALVDRRDGRRGACPRRSPSYSRGCSNDTRRSRWRCADDPAREHALWPAGPQPAR